MSQLYIRFAPGVSDTGRAFVPLQIIHLRSNEVLSQLLRLDEDLTVDVAAGNHVVRAVLPSGEMLYIQTAVAPGAKAEVVLEPAVKSPSESLAWAFYLKAPLREGKRLRQKTEDRANASEAAELKAAQPDLNLLRIADAGGDRIRWVRPEGPTLSRGGRGWFTYVRRLVAEFSVDAKKEPLWLQVRGVNYPPRLTALPPGEVDGLMFLDETPGQDSDPLNVVVRSASPQAETLLGYLTQGAFDLARQVAPTVEATSRNQSPSDAAIYGYYQARTKDGEAIDPWLNRLAQWPAMSDGAIIVATLLQRRPTHDPEEVRNWFLVASSRGLPVYTMGLRMLLNGLNQFSHRSKGSDTQVTRALDRTNLYAAAADWAAVTTTFYGDPLDFPTPKAWLRT